MYLENLTNVFGTKLREQVEERLNFYQSGDLPRKNVEVMNEAEEENKVVVKKLLKKKKKKSIASANGEFYRKNER